MNKKAISPLIATVLLIALAVAIGAVIMAYTGSLGECGKVEIRIPLDKGSPDICYDAAKYSLRFSLEDGEKQDIEMFKLTFYGSVDIANIELEEALGVSETKRFTIPYNQKNLGELTKLKIVPVIMQESKQVVCPADKSLIIENIPPCEST